MNGLFIHGLTADPVQLEAVALLKGNGRPSRVATPLEQQPLTAADRQQRRINTPVDLKTTLQGTRRDLENPKIEADGPEQTFEFPGRLKGEAQRQGLARCHRSCSGHIAFTCDFCIHQQKCKCHRFSGGSLTSEATVF